MVVDGVHGPALGKVPEAGILVCRDCPAQNGHKFAKQFDGAGIRPDQITWGKKGKVLHQPIRVLPHRNDVGASPEASLFVA